MQKSLREIPRRLLAYRYPVLLCSVSRRVFLDHAAVEIAVALLLLDILLLDQLVAVVDADALDLVAVVVLALDAVDAQSLTLRATTGSISGTLAGRMADYTIRSSVSTGSNSLPEALDGGARTLNADTTTGSIRLSFADAK